MNISAISKNQNFNGLLSCEVIFDGYEDLYGGEYQCDYYKRYYYPFADESQYVAKNEMKSLEAKLNHMDCIGPSNCGSYERLVMGKPLKITRADFDCLRKELVTEHVLDIIG